MHAGSKHSTFTVLQYLYTLLYLQDICVSAARAISQRAERELGSPFNCFLPEASTDL